MAFVIRDGKHAGSPKLLAVRGLGTFKAPVRRS